MRLVLITILTTLAAACVNIHPKPIIQQGCSHLATPKRPDSFAAISWEVWTLWQLSNGLTIKQQYEDLPDPKWLDQVNAEFDLVALDMPEFFSLAGDLVSQSEAIDAAHSWIEVCRGAE